MKKDEITKYIEAMYSEKSSLNEIQDLGERKKEAAKKAGLDLEAKSTQDIMTLKNEAVNVRIFNYLSQTQSNNYISLVSDQQLLWEIQFDKMRPLDEDADSKDRLKDRKIKLEISRQAQELLDRVTSLYQSIYKYDGEIMLGQRQIRMLSPEQRVKKIA